MRNSRSENTQRDAESLRRHACKHLPEAIFDLMVSFRPYEDGDRALWAINKITNTKKHQIIVPVCVQSGGTTFNGRVSGGWSSGHGGWDSAKQEIEISRLGPGANVDLKVRVTPYIAFSDVAGIDGAPVVPTLKLMWDKVQAILSGVEAEAYRLGVFQQ